MLTLGMEFEIVNLKFYRQQFCKVLQKKFNFTCNEPILLDVEAWLNDFTPLSYRAHSAMYMFPSLKENVTGTCMAGFLFSFSLLHSNWKLTTQTMYGWITIQLENSVFLSPVGESG